jgi:hypothetical protein
MSHQCNAIPVYSHTGDYSAKALCSYMGHSSITMTLDRYGHLMPGNEGEAAEMLTAYLDASWGRQLGAAAPR